MGSAPSLPVLQAEMQGICETGPWNWTEAAGGQLEEQPRVQGAPTENTEGEEIFLKLGPGTGVRRENA